MQEIRTKEINQFSKRKGNSMKNLALLALAAVVALSVSTASANIKTATTTAVEVIKTTELGRAAMAAMNGGKAVATVTEQNIFAAQILAQAVAAAQAKGVAPEQAINDFAAGVKSGKVTAADMKNYVVKAQAAVTAATSNPQGKALFSKASNSVAAKVAEIKASNVFKSWLDTLSTALGKGLTAADLKEIENNVALASALIGLPVYGDANMCSQANNECFASFLPPAVTAVGKVTQLTGVAERATKQNVAAYGAKALAQIRSIPEEEAAKALCEVGTKCPTTINAQVYCPN